MEKMLKLAFLGALLTGLLALAYMVLQHFLSPTAWAVILAYTTWPLHARLTRHTRGSTALSAIAMVVVLIAAIIAPCFWLSYLLQDELLAMYRDLGETLNHKPAMPEFLRNLPLVGADLERWFDQLTNQENLRGRLLPWIQTYSGHLLRFIGDIGQIAVTLTLTLFIVFFLYRDGLRITREVSRVLHLVLGERVNAYLSTAGSTVKAVVYGLVLTAIGQGAIAGLGYAFVGLGSPVLLTVVTMMFAMIPFGTPLIWGGASVWLLLHGEHLAGIELLVWGAAVVSWVDNVIRPMVISSNTSIPFLLVFFGVLGGLGAFGFIGLFVGPVVLAVVLAVWREWLEQQASEAPSPP